MVRFLVLAFAMVCLSSCTPRRDTDAINKTLYDCEILASPEGQPDAQHGDLWFYVSADRAQLSQSLLTPYGRSAVETRLQSSQNQVERECLERLLREIENRDVE